MSLVSEADRLMVIDALEFFILSLKGCPNPDPERITQYTSLLSWVKLEHMKKDV